jgi:hypothetical protein
MGVGNTRVAAPGPKRADHFGGVSSKKNAARIQMVQALRLVRIRANPNDVALDVLAKLPLQALANHIFAAGNCGVGVGCHLVIDAPHRIAHQVKDAVRSQLPTVLDVLVHIEPTARNIPS